MKDKGLGTGREVNSHFEELRHQGGLGQTNIGALLVECGPVKGGERWSGKVG